MSPSPAIKLDSRQASRLEGIMQERLPAFLAVDEADADVMQALLAANPEAAQEKDDKFRRDKFPLHYALEKQASSDLVLALLVAYPTAAASQVPSYVFPNSKLERIFSNSNF